MSEIEKIEPVIFKINTASGSGTGFYIQDQNKIDHVLKTILHFYNIPKIKSVSISKRKSILHGHA